MTIRSIAIGVLLTLVFTAANIYLGLKVALVFGTSIPAAVISMAALSFFKDSSVLENNIVQTVASAAGAMSAMVFFIPGLLIVGWWAHLPFWTTFWICASGGVLGVIFAIPLRRVMTVKTDLPYPEGVAAAELLSVGSNAHKKSSEAAREGFVALLYGAAGSAALSLVAATRAAASGAAAFFRIGGSVSGYQMSFSMALLGAGYLVGLPVGLAIFVGIVIAWGGAVPFLSTMAHSNGMTVQQLAMSVWLQQVRFIGAGCMAVAALSVVAKYAVAIGRGVISARAVGRSGASAADSHNLDLPQFWIVVLSVICFGVIGCLLAGFLFGTPLAGHWAILVGTALAMVLIVGMAVAALGGYMAGLIGTSNSPVSGIGILAILIAATVFVAVVPADNDTRATLTSFALFAATIVFAIAISANTNLQTFRIGQMLGAKPQAQEWAMIIGVVTASLVVPPVLNLLNESRGFVETATHTAPLAAPQANLMASLASNVISQHPDWRMIGIGAVIGLVVIALDALLGLRKAIRLPPLCVGMGIYLPMAITMPVVLGAMLGYSYRRFWAAKTADPEHAQRLGVLVASGMIVGESLFAVFMAGLIGIFNSDTPLALLPKDFGPATTLGWIVFALLISELYSWKIRHTRSTKPAAAQLATSGHKRL